MVNTIERFLKSEYITSVCWPLKKDSTIACLIVIRLVTDGLLLRNPYCCGTRIFLKIEISLLLTIFENILGRIEIIDIGR